MRVLSYQVENHRKIRFAQLALPRNLVKFSGPNESGKSTMLDGVWMTLAGAGAVTVTPISTGEERMTLTLWLGEQEVEYIVTRRLWYKPDGVTLTTDLSIVSPQGAKYGSPQTLLAEKCGVLNFDPPAFMNMEPKKQRATLAALMGLSAMLDTMAASDKNDFEQRTNINRELNSAKARLQAIAIVNEVAPVVVRDILEEMKVARLHNDTCTLALQAREVERREIAQMREKAMSLRAEANRLLLEAESIAEAAERRSDVLEVAEPIAELRDLTALENRLANAELINKQHEQYLQRTQLVAEVAKLQADSDALTELMAEREKERAAVIRTADMPIQGLGLTAEGVTYEGLPLEAASQAKRLRIALAIAVAQNPQLKVLRVQDWPLFDEDAKAEMIAWAERHDFQLWVEEPTVKATDGFVMEDGTVRLASAEASATEPTSEAPPKRQRKAAGV